MIHKWLEKYLWAKWPKPEVEKDCDGQLPVPAKWTVFVELKSTFPLIFV